MNEKLKTFKIEVDDIENVDFEHGMIQEIAKAYADAMDLIRYELVLNKNIITIKDKITGINSYMGMKVSLEPLEKDISFIVRPSNQPTYEQLQQENKILKENAENNDKVVDKVNWENQLLKKENKQLKDNWNELKEFIVKEYYMYLPLEASTKSITILIDKMAELEQGNLIEK